MALNPEQIETSSLMSRKDLLKLIPISRNKLWELENEKNENMRLPSYKVGGKRLYKLNEILWWLDKHKFEPNK